MLKNLFYAILKQINFTYFSKLIYKVYFCVLAKHQFSMNKVPYTRIEPNNIVMYMDSGKLSWYISLQIPVKVLDKSCLKQIVVIWLSLLLIS